MKKIVAFIFLFTCQQTFSQNRDSLLQIAYANKKDTNTVKAMRALAGISNAEKTKDAILKLIENDIPLQISCPIMKQNRDCYNDVIEWAKKHKVHRRSTGCTRQQEYWMDLEVRQY